MGPGPNSVETSLDAADTIVRATRPWPIHFPLPSSECGATSGGQKLRAGGQGTQSADPLLRRRRRRFASDRSVGSLASQGICASPDNGTLLFSRRESNDWDLIDDGVRAIERVGLYGFSLSDP